LEISLKFTLHDFEKALIQQGAPNLNIGSENESEKADLYVGNYLSGHFQIWVNGKETNCDFIGKELSEDYASLWCYFEISNIEKVEKIKVQNSILTDVFEEQLNLVHINISEDSQVDFQLNASNTSKEIIF
jgi:hypothetical protein